MTRIPDDPYATHLLVLDMVLEHQRGRVLELGVGHYSTPLLHEYSKTKHIVTSLDSSETWLSKFEYMRSPRHEMIHVPDWEKCELLDHYWTIAFIDQDPEPSRGPVVLRLAEQTKFIVCHDTENPIYRWDFSKFKYRKDDKSRRPWTTVVSMFDDLSWLNLEQER